jgi:hypothetical protein
MGDVPRVWVAPPPRGDLDTSQTYEDRTDIETLKSQWHKPSGLHTREEWSAAIVRAATAAEVAANFLVRVEFARSQSEPEFVGNLLLWINGLARPSSLAAQRDK